MHFSLFRGDMKVTELASLAKQERVIVLAGSGRGFWGKKGPNLLLSVEKEDAVLMTLIEEYEKLNRHYDNQRHYFLNVLILIAASLSSAPFLFSNNPSAFKVLAMGSALVIIAMGFVGLNFLGLIWTRMKRMQLRSQMLQCKLIEDSSCDHWENESKRDDDVSDICTDMEIAIIRNRGDAIADFKAKAGIRSVFRGRGGMWYLIPWLVIVYAIAYLIGISFFIPI